MKQNKLVTGAIAIALAFSVASCRKDDDTPPPVDNTGEVKLEFSNRAGNQPLTLGNWYVTANNDSLKPSMFKYYISNIKLNGDGSNVYTEAESYHLVNHEVSSSRSFDLANVPAGTYNSITFMIGVDSARNTSGAQTGALDPANDMFWTWLTGYIMVKMEGTSPKSNANNNRVVLHIGGFQGENNVLKTVTLNFPQPITVNNNNPHVHIYADMLKMFTPNLIDFSTTTTVMAPGATAKKIADNYATMFSVNAVE